MDNRNYLVEFEKYKYQSEHDELTSLYNRKKFYAATRRLLDSIGEEVYVFIRFDIDRFKMINTFFGIERGDNLLCYIAKLLRYIPKKYPKCTYGRIQADIFCICIPYDPVEVQHLLAHFERVLARYDKNYDIVPSVGLYIIKNKQQTIENIYNKATLAAMRCKGSYVEHMSYYDHKIRQQMMMEQEVTNYMNTALQEEQFKLFFQPQYSLADRKMIGAEVLVRWIHPHKGLIAPGSFVPLFEKNGFIAKMDYYIWEKACQFIRTHLDAGIDFGYLSVNVSRVDIYSPQFFRKICYLVEKYQIPPHLLHLELTESAYTDNPVMIKQIVKRLQDYGFLVMMDDFGSGYSSLNMLKDINVDILKVDMMFMRDSEIRGRSENILTSIIRMARWLQTPVVVEGVETVEQEQFLRSIGCENAQGYLYAKPVPLAEYERMLLSCEIAKPQVPMSDECHNISVDEFWSSSSQINALFNTIINAVGVYELSGDQLELIRANEGFYKVTGEERESFNRLAKNILSVVYREDRANVLARFRSAIGREEPVMFEYRRYGKDGAIAWMRMNIRHMLHSGQRDLYYGVFTNITKEKQHEQLLHWENEKLHTVLENSDIYVWEYDIVHRCLLGQNSESDAYDTDYIMQHAPESMIELGFVNAQSAEEYRRLYREISQGLKNAEGDICYNTRKGNKAWYHVVMTVHFDDSGAPERAIGCARFLRNA